VIVSRPVGDLPCHLETVLTPVLNGKQLDVLGRAIGPHDINPAPQHPGFIEDITLFQLVLNLLKLVTGKLDAVMLFQLNLEVLHQIGFVALLKPLVAHALQLFNEFLFHLQFALGAHLFEILVIILFYQQPRSRSGLSHG